MGWFLKGMGVAFGVFIIMSFSALPLETGAHGIAKRIGFGLTGPIMWTGIVGIVWVPRKLGIWIHKKVNDGKEKK